MRRSCNSLTSINSLTSHNSFNSTTSLSSIGSRTKIYNNRDFQRYIANIEDNYNYFSEKYNNKINKIVNRYENRTNQLFMDLRHREDDYRNICCKIDNILKNTSTTTVYKVIDIDTEDIERRFRYTLFVLYIYTFIVLRMVWNL